MIELQDVEKRLGSTRALDGLDMHVPDGVVYGLVGPNGAGKTTTIRHLCGVMRADAGKVFVAGEPVFENPKVKARIATIQSDPYGYGQATVEDLHKLWAGVYASFDESRFEELGAEFGIERKRRVRDLSRGMKKQVAFWLALSARPELLLLDEPADGLDPIARHTVWSLVMGDVAESGMTVLTSSHNLRELTDVCDWVGIMEHGRMRMERPLSEMQTHFAKVQVAFPDDVLALPEGVEVLSRERQGRLFSLVVKGAHAEVEEAFQALDPAPVFFNLLPLSLEEIFIYELGGEDDASGDDDGK